MRVKRVVVGRLCQTPRRLTEWSLRTLSDIDGQGRRPSEWGTSESTALQFQLLTKDSFERAESIVGVTVRPLAESEW